MKKLVMFQYEKSNFKALFSEHRSTGISVHLKDRQVGKETIDRLGFPS